jgi:hypothetical protein
LHTWKAYRLKDATRTTEVKKDGTRMLQAEKALVRANETVV